MIHITTSLSKSLACSGLIFALSFADSVMAQSQSNVEKAMEVKTSTSATGKSSETVQSNNTAAETGPTRDYSIKLKARPDYLRRWGMAIYPLGNNQVTAFRGQPIAKLSAPATGYEISPIGVNFLVVTAGKKEKEAALYDMRTENLRVKKFGKKPFGEPQAIGYTPDGRYMLLATADSICVLEPKKYRAIRSIAIDFAPNTLLMSNDGYYLAATDGHKLTVYNFEEGTPRKTWKLSETITGMRFSPDNSQFAFLTDDGLLSIFDTRNFSLKQDLDDIGIASDFDYNLDGKYVAVISGDDNIQLINLLRPEERENIAVEEGGAHRLIFLSDASNNTLLAYSVAPGLHVKRIQGLEPYYGKLMADEVAALMNEWLKMQPGETMEQYRARVNDESRTRQQRLFEDEISTRFANNLLELATVSFGKYDRGSQMLEVNFSNMPSIFLPVPEAEVTTFTNPEDLEFSDTKYGLLPNDSFEIIYAKIHNKGNDKSYIYDNLNRQTLSFMEGDENVVSIAVIQQQQMEELRLQELRERVIAEAKSANIISDHTHITVDSRVEPSYDANGKKILNYIINFEYEVEPDFSVKEDFGPGKYEISESGAAGSMLRIIEEALQGDFAQYVKAGKKLKVKISGAADATPIHRIIPYNGIYGDFQDEVVVKDGVMSGMTITAKDGITQNEQLAFLRAYGVKDYLEKNVKGLTDMISDFTYNIAVSEGKGSEFRRITTEFTFVDAL